MWQPTPTPMQELLEKVSLRWIKDRGLESGYFFVSTAWLPVVKAGCGVWEHTEEDRVLWGTLFVSGSFGKKLEWQPTVHQGECIVTGVVGDCWQLSFRASELTFIPNGAGRAPAYMSVKRVRILGREADCVVQRGFIGRNEPNWKTEYHLKFDDGTRFIAYWGQFEVIE